MDSDLLLIIGILCSAAAAGLLLDPILALWDKISMGYVADQIKLAHKISMDTSSMMFYLRIWGVLIVGVLIIGICTINYFILSIIVAFFIFILPRQIMNYLVKKREICLRDQLITAIGIITNTVKAGVTLEQSIPMVAREIPAPLGYEFQRMVDEYNHGVTFEQTLQDTKVRLELQGFIIFATALITNKKRGGNVLLTLNDIRSSLVENQRLERKLEATTANGRMVIYLLSIFPLGFLALSWFLNPEGTILLFTKITGQLTLLISALLVYGGFRMGQKIIDIKF